MCCYGNRLGGLTGLCVKLLFSLLFNLNIFTNSFLRIEARVEAFPRQKRQHRQNAIPSHLL